ncbi:MAG TPA: hypothetical protein VK153_01990 [Candidatus Paceibacterota bacterium]|nr:hypothetical protein [Candidatus Paceibacterota bacterium]
MNKIILEDMKLNKNRKQTSLKKEIVTPAIHHEELAKNIHINKKEEDAYEEISKEEEKREKEKINEYFKSIKKEKQRFYSTPRERKEPKVLHNLTLVIFLLALLVGAAYWSGNAFQKANITITSKYELLNYKNKQFIASKDENSNDVNFEIMITSDKKPVNIVLTEPKEVSLKAEGSITLYNEFSAQAQRIGVGTYVSDDDGKTYKTNSTVSIPGYKTVNKKIVPGQITVKITSFLPGDAYNGSPENFRINVFKGTAKYNKIYGKLKDPLAGGASGIVYAVDSSNQKNIDNIANTSLKESLFKQVEAMVPEGYILYPNAAKFTYTTGNNSFSKTPEAEVEMEGTLAVILLKEESLVKNIVRVSFPNIKGDELKEITISDLDELSFNFVNPNQLITKDMSSVPFYLTGNINAIWKPDIESLKLKLLGIPKNDVLSVFRQDPGISSAIVKVFPPWQKNIPEDISKIIINMQ